MGRKTYKCIGVQDGSRIILGDKRAFGNDRVFYNQLEEELKDDWVQMQAAKSTDRRTEFRVRDHVLVKSLKCNGLQRAIIQDVSGANTSMQERSYSVFLYDEGDFEDIEEHRIIELSQNRKEQLEPRSVIVRLTGIVPAKIVMDLARKALNPDDDSAFIVTQDSSWTPRTIRNVEEWLKNRDVKYLGLITTKTNDDGSVYGDIYRRLKSTAVKEDDRSDGGGKARKMSTKDKQFLSKYIVDQKFALYNEGLAQSQMALRVQESRVGANDVENATSSHSKKAPDCDEITRTKQRFPPVPFASRSDSVNKRTMEGVVADASPQPKQTESTAEEKSSSTDVLSDHHSTKDGRGNENLLTTSTKNEPKSDNVAVDDVDLQLDEDELSSISESSLMELMEGHNLPATQLISTMDDSGSRYRINVPGKLLVRGKMVRPPYKNKHEFQLNNSILRALDTLQIHELSDMHKIVAPNFIRGSDIIVIAADGGNQHGKNIRVLSYILPILRLVYNKYGDDIRGFVDGEAPEAVIVVNSFNTGFNLESYINQLLNFSQELPVRVKFLSKDSAEASQKHTPSFRRRLIPGGIVIMILTMSYLSKVMQTAEGPRLFEKLRFLVFEELDMYLRKDKEDILTFIEAARLNMKVCTGSLPFQITFSGSKWVAEMENLYKEIVKDRAPMVTISAPNQVLRYAKIKWKVHYLPEEETRLQKLNDVLEKKCLPAHRRIVIACCTPEVATQVYRSITLLDGQQLLSIISGMEKSALTFALEAWQKNSMNVLIISDDMMKQVEITDATCLICFDSPQLVIQDGVRRALAAERFGYLWANIRHIEAEHSIHGASLLALKSLVKSQELIAHFLMTGEEHNFYQMYKFAHSLEADIEFPVELKLYAEMLEEAGKTKNVAMCEGIKLFGFCNHYDPEICLKRHFFLRNELSSTPSGPLQGEIEIRIIRCENPSSYQAELLRHFLYENGKRICNHSYINDSRSRLSKLNKYYGSGDVDQGENVEHLQLFNEGVWCAVKVRDPIKDYFARAKVEKVVQKDKYGQPITIRVYCVDSGLILNPAVDQLYVLPEEFQNWSPLVVNLILCNLKPVRSELEYRQSHIKKARDITADKIYNARIWLSVCNTIWVNPMVEYHMDSITKRPYRGDSVRMLYISNEREKIAEFSRSHLKTLMALVNRHPGVYKGITSIANESNEFSDEMLIAKQEFHQIGEEIKWAFVGKSKRNKFDPAKIVTQYGYDPWVFFGVHEKYYSELKSLEKELDTCIEKYINGSGDDKRFINPETGESIFTNEYYQVGMAVAARERTEQTWMRGLLVQKGMKVYKGDEDSGEKDEECPEFEIFFVDYGDTCYDMTVHEIFPIPHKFVDRMPFQAIAFRLDHIEPLDNAEEGWSEREKCEFLDIIVKDELSIDVELVALEDVYDGASGSPVPCRYYNALALYKDTELGSILVQKGAAKLKPGSENIIQEVERNLLNFYNVSVDEGLASDNDDEDYDDDLLEEFDINISSSDMLNLMGIQKNGKILPDILMHGARTPSGELLFNRQQPALPAAAPEAALPAISTAPTTVKSKSVKEKPTSSSKVPISVLKDGLLHPTVYWRQTESTFIMTLQLPDIKEFELKVLDDKNTIDFKTMDKSPNYGFKIKVYGKLHSEYATHLTGQYMRITFKKKMTGVLWSRALYSKTEKFLWLKEDLDYVQDQDEDAEDSVQEAAIRKSMSQMAQAAAKEDNSEEELEDTCLVNYGDSDDDDDFDDDD